MSRLQQLRKRVPFALVIMLVAFGSAVAGDAFWDRREAVKGAGGVHQISLTDRMRPEALRIKTGESIQINPKDGKTHLVAKGQGKQGAPSDGANHNHNSGSEQVVRADEGYRVRFDQPGIFYYHDHENPAASTAVVVSSE